MRGAAAADGRSRDARHRKAIMTLEERMEKVEAVTTLAYRRSRLALMLGLGAAALSVALAAMALWIAWQVR